jgi:hypothetical protein
MDTLLTKYFVNVNENFRQLRAAQRWSRPILAIVPESRAIWTLAPALCAAGSNGRLADKQGINKTRFFTVFSRSVCPSTRFSPNSIDR